MTQKKNGVGARRPKRRAQAVPDEEGASKRPSATQTPSDAGPSRTDDGKRPSATQTPSDAGPSRTDDGAASASDERPASGELGVASGARLRPPQSREIPTFNHQVQLYCQDQHWHGLFFAIPEQRVYYFEGYGVHEPPPAIRGAVDALPGWSLHSLKLELQTDGCNCGPWDLVAAQLFVDYVNGSDWGSCRFREFAVAELQRSGVADLAQVQRGQKRAASARNVAYIQERRGDLRATLRAAARNGWLPFTQTTMRGRNSSASRQAQYVSLLSDDDD